MLKICTVTGERMGGRNPDEGQREEESRLWDCETGWQQGGGRQRAGINGTQAVT